MTGAISLSGRRSPLESKPAAMVDAKRLTFRSLVVLRHLPWENGDMHERHYDELHLLAYPNPKTRPERLDITGRARGQMAQPTDRRL